MVYPPLLKLKHAGDPTIPIPTVLGRQLNHATHQPRLIAWDLRLPPLG
jgi:hypothetical protein